MRYSHRLVRRMGSAGAALTVAAGILLGLGSPSASASRPPHVHLVSTTPASSGSLTSITWDLPHGEPPSLDPIKSGTYSPSEVIENMCDDLLREMPTFGIKSALATSWRYSNPTTLVFQIRKGVHFWNGQELTATDVTYSLLRNKDKAIGSINETFFSDVSSITSTGPYEVTVRFKTPDVLFLKLMATIVGAVGEKSYIEKEATNYGSTTGGVMCTGPYELTKWTAGNDIVLKANPHYWTPAYRPKIKKVIIKWLTDTATLTSALLSGEIDGVYQAPATSFSELETSGSGRLYFGPSLRLTFLNPTTNSGPIGNIKIRRALSLAINRSEIVNFVYDGAAVPNLALTPQTTWTATAKSVFESAYAKLQSTKPDLAEAKRLVQSVPDHSSPITIGFEAGNQTQLSLVTAVEQIGTEIGLHIKLDELPPLDFEDAYYTASYRKGLDLLFFTGGLYVNTQLTYTSSLFPKGTAFDYTTYTNATVNKDLADAFQTSNAVARAKLLTKAQAIYMKDYIIIPLVSADNSLFLNKTITGAPVSTGFNAVPFLAELGAASK